MGGLIYTTLLLCSTFRQRLAVATDLTFSSLFDYPADPFSLCSGRPFIGYPAREYSVYAHAYICRAERTLRAAFGFSLDPEQRTRISGPHEELAHRAAGKRRGETDSGFLRRARYREERECRKKSRSNLRRTSTAMRWCYKSSTS